MSEKETCKKESQVEVVIFIHASNLIQNLWPTYTGMEEEEKDEEEEEDGEGLASRLGRLLSELIPA